jgi:hypothetical protein
LAQKHRDKDCGTYGGYLHTDHAIRSEFFAPEECPLHKNTPYQMDFTYIFDTNADDYFEFMVGEPVNEAEMIADIGPVGETQIVSGAERKEDSRPIEVKTRIESALDELRQNAMSDDEIEELLR